MCTSVVRTNPGVWSLGTFMLCEEYTGDTPQDALATWEDVGKKYYLHRRKSPITRRTPPDGDFDTGRFYDTSETASLWELTPNVFVKAKAWAPGMSLEIDTINWVRQTFPQVPVVEAIHGWVDPAWERSFLITRRMEGEPLETAWPRLSKSEKLRIIEEVMATVTTMATVTSETFRSIGGGHRFVLFLDMPPRDPTQWRRAPRVYPQYTIKEFDEAMKKCWDTIKDNPKTERFVFFHADLTPGNVFIKSKGDGQACLSGLIDFEVSGFYPVWYPPMDFTRVDYWFQTKEDWKYEYALGLLHHVRKSFPEQKKWQEEAKAIDHNFEKFLANKTIEDEEWEQLQKQKRERRAAEGESINIDDVACSLDDLVIL